MLEPTQSLTDQYLADLEDLEEGSSVASGDEAPSEDAMDHDQEFDEEAAELEALKGGDALEGGLWKSEKLGKHMELVEARLKDAEEKEELDHDEYTLVVQSNSLISELDNEIVALNKSIRDMYAPKFPELESLILNPLDYARVVKRIKNEMDLTLVDLSSLLPSATIMVLSVTASTTSGKPLPEAVLEKILSACDQVLDLDDARQKMLTFVESRMNRMAPNMCALVGSSVASHLMVQGGGMLALARMPACNLQMIGSKRRHLNGMSLASMTPGAGFLHNSEIVSKAPPDLKKKAVKLLANKCTLVARVDACREDPTGSVGRTFRLQVEKQLDKMQEPPPQKKKRALPAPDDKPRKKRGGKRVRKLKEKLASSEMQKMANRLAFGVAEEEVHLGGDTMKGLGMIGKNQGNGKLRLQAKDQKIKLSQKAQQRRGLTAMSSGATGGISSTVTMTPTTGMIFEEMRADNSGTMTPARLLPAAQQADTTRYFGATTFHKVKKEEK